MVNIKMDKWYVADSSTPHIGFSGENRTEDVYITPSEMQEYTYTAEILNGGQIIVVPLSKVVYGGVDALHALLTSGQIGAAGTAKMQIVARRSGGSDMVVVKKSNVFAVSIGESINAGDAYADMPASAFEQYVTAAGESADKAKEYAEVAQNESKTSGENATRAGEHANAAKEAAGKAAASESNARQAAEDAQRYATSDYALQAKSWAVGGTGKRTGEDTDNAKYYAGMAKDHASSAGKSESNAKGSAASASESSKNAGEYSLRARSAAEAAEKSSSAAGKSAVAAGESAKAAADSAKTAGASEANAVESAKAAADSEKKASASKEAAGKSAEAAADSKTAAGKSEEAAAKSAQAAKDYAASIEYRFGIDPVSGLPAIMKYEEE